ncbi:MAG: cation:dicarboxylase symporter family transporter [Chlamydiae bacterium]|nr:cation:dicarboxylase symporter family transporter [Chlamydiota bacterium]
MFKKMPIILLIVIALSALTQKYIPLDILSFIYAISLTIKSVLIFVLPALIFLLLFKTASHLAQGATKLIFLILLFVVLSNFTSTFTSFGIGTLIHKLEISFGMPEHKQELSPLWVLSLPQWLSNGMALLAGALAGILGSFIKHPVMHKLRWVADIIVSWILRVFLYIIPIFVAGFIIKLAHDEILYTIVKEYALIFAIVAASQALYICLLYFFINKCSLKETAKSIKNMLPAAFVGFGAMSSAAAMPLTLIGAEKNAKHKDIAASCIPATVNIHLIGDCLAIPLFAFAVLKNFSLPEPSLIQYSLFAVFFVLAKFSVAAIPGGGIIVMLPILESYLGFTPEMLSLITALYILFDPVITTANVLGNGAFSQGIDRFYNFITRKGHKAPLL